MSRVDAVKPAPSARLIAQGRIRLLTLAGVLGALAACHESGGTGAEDAVPNLVRDKDRIQVPEGSALRGSLVVAPVQRQSLQAALDAPAVLEADPSRIASILPPLSGRVRTLDVHLGDAVTVGQALFTLDSADLAQARADLKTSSAALALAKKNFERTKDLHDHGIAAQRDLEQAQSDLAAAESEHERATAVFTALGVPLETRESPRELTVRSPIAGRVTALNAAAGTFANDSTAPLMVIADTRTLWVAAGVQEKDLATLAPDEPARITVQSFPGESFDGRIAFVSDQLEPDTRTTKVRVALDNASGRLKPGMFAHVRFAGAPHEALALPTAALVQHEAETRVYVEVAPWTFEPRVVTAGASVGETSEILAGLKEGERVVTRQGVLLDAN